MRIYISEFYKGYSSKEELNIYHLINLTELDFKSKFNNTSNTFDDNDDDDLFFRTSILNNSKKSLKKPLISFKKHKLSSTEPSNLSASLSEKSDSELLGITKKDTNKNSSLSDSLKQPSQSPENLKELDNAPPVESNFTSELANESNKKNVQFTLSDEQDSNDNTAEILDNKKSTWGKKATRSKRSSKNSESKPFFRKSPHKRGGILDIAVNKIIEINDDDDILQKSDTSFMDIESDYHTQNDDKMRDDNDDDASN
ncbi:hypothetical protein RCL_jg8151.t1 [Rhizophagus clarus]|uniref:Uncharacterized protein n=1 Tax=Rhizophagus clarus TaxID=94130 RepID=A0A8H3MHZ4_9GLOM|nr:hypothetical protein RCL_jg8151.t1 [Rhizophagus clarus]